MGCRGAYLTRRPDRLDDTSRRVIGSKAEAMPFKPGQSGNPSGRKPTDHRFMDEIRKREPAALEVLDAAMKIKKGEKPDPQAVRAAETIMAYSRGRPVQTQNVRVIRSIEDLSDEELQMLAGVADEEAQRARH
jgi:DNA-directed RNA polymerase specialized sigma24 family protein